MLKSAPRRVLAREQKRSDGFAMEGGAAAG